MSDRDDLEELIAKAVYCVPMEGHSYLYEIETDSPGAAADAVLAAGWRRSTVTPEQAEAAAQRMYASFHEQAAKSGEQPTPYDFMPWGVNSTVTKFWLEIAQAGLSVGEDGAS